MELSKSATKMKGIFTKKVIKTIFTIIAWHGITWGHSILSKVILNEFNYPFTVTIVQFLSTTILTWPVITFKWVKPKHGWLENLELRYWLFWLIPLAVVKIITSTSSQWSLAKLSLSYVHTVKACQPVFTVAFIRIAFQKKQSNLVYLSLLPIIGGVGIASYSEDTFNYQGFISVVISTIGVALLSIYNKQFLTDTKMHSMELALILTQICLLLFAPVWFATEFRTLLSKILVEDPQATPINWLRVSGLLVADGVLSFVQTIFVFLTLSLVSHLTYSVANATRRIEIILGGIIVLHDHASLFKISGMSLAVVGVFFYTFAKHLMNKNKERNSLDAVEDGEPEYIEDGYEKLEETNVEMSDDEEEKKKSNESAPLFHLEQNNWR